MSAPLRIISAASTPTVERWHDSVGFYQIENAADGELIGQFYLDLYARENKRGGAWMDECVNRYRIDGKTQIPVAYLTCNLTPPIGDEPALFTHDEVITLFHEFGHGLHHMLTRIDVPEVSGINGVEWDAVELPSQFMENFCWEREALELFARHYQTGETAAGRRCSSACWRRAISRARCKCCARSSFAVRYSPASANADVESAEKIQQILDQVRDEVSVVKTPPSIASRTAFHIFLQAVMPRVIIATSGRRSCPPTPLRHLKKKAYSILKPGKDFCIACSNRAVPGPRWSRFAVFAAASRDRCAC